MPHSCHVGAQIQGLWVSVSLQGPELEGLAPLFHASYSWTPRCLCGYLTPGL